MNLDDKREKSKYYLYNNGVSTNIFTYNCGFWFNDFN